jgi:hypothetical protein
VALPPAPPELETLLGGADEPEPPRPAGCVLRGGGERANALRDAPPFHVFTRRAAAVPALQIVSTRSVQVTWSLPRAGAGGRARIALGGQRLVRIDGWADLEGRAFQVRRRADVHPDHVWVRGGSPVEVLGVADGAIRVRADSTFEAPRQVDALTSCDNLVYEPAALPRPEDERLPEGSYAYPSGPRLELHAAPGGPSLLAFTMEAPRAQDLRWIEARDGFARVAGQRGDLEFDAWVPEAQVERPRHRTHRSSLTMSNPSLLSCLSLCFIFNLAGTDSAALPMSSQIRVRGRRRA